MVKGLEGLKVVTLYRVSSKKQMGTQDDLWDQKNIVQKFIYENKMNIVREFIEGGVSGFKRKAQEREAIEKIEDMAINKEFDALVIYHSNRFGRSDDLAQIISRLYIFGVRVISTLEGELKADTDSEKMLNNLRFSYNAQESIMKQHVISDYQLSMVENGRFRGGDVPYGYQLIDNGRENYKGRSIYDVAIFSDEAEIVKVIYGLSVDKNYGARKIATYLNDNINIYPTRSGGPWYYSTVNYILNNRMYLGQYHMDSKIKGEKASSVIQEDLIIISPDIWEANQTAILKRKTVKNKRNIGEKKNPDLNHTNEGLLTGLVYCGHCGKKLSYVVANKYYTRKNGTVNITVTQKYRCSSKFARGGIECSGQTTYGVLKVDAKVIDETRKTILRLASRNLSDDFFDVLTGRIDELNKNKRIMRGELEKSYLDLKLLRIKSTEETNRNSINEINKINARFEKIENNIKELNKNIAEIECCIKTAKNEKDMCAILKETINKDEAVFDNCSNDKKRLILELVIDKVEVFKDRIKIRYSNIVEMYLMNPKKHTE